MIIEFLNPENMRVAVGILLLSGLQPEIHVGVGADPPWPNSLTATISIGLSRVNGISLVAI